MKLPCCSDIFASPIVQPFEPHFFNDPTGRQLPGILEYGTGIAVLQGMLFLTPGQDRGHLLTDFFTIPSHEGKVGRNDNEIRREGEVAIAKVQFLTVQLRAFRPSPSRR